MERTQGWILAGLGLTISASGVLTTVAAALLEGVRRANMNFYSAAAKLDVDPGIEPLTVTVGVGGIGMMGAGVYVANQGLITLENVRTRRANRSA